MVKKAIPVALVARDTDDLPEEYFDTECEEGKEAGYQDGLAGNYTECPEDKSEAWCVCYNDGYSDAQDFIRENILAPSITYEADLNDGQTTIVPHRVARFKVVSGSSLIDYVLSSSCGRVWKEKTGLPTEIEDETVLFRSAEIAYLDYEPAGGVTWRWIGNDGGNPIFDGRKVTLPGACVGVLQVDYTTLYDVAAVQCGETGDVIVCVEQGGKTDCASVVFAPDEDEDPDAVPYELLVKDFCSDTDLSGVTVILDGVEVGTTNASGLISLGSLVPGSAHTLVMSKDGYVPSESDHLNNDSFTVPS